jgi:hypothetical protein
VKKKFERFVGVDWSGSKGRCHKGIQVAEFSEADAHPKLIPPREGKHWSRSGVIGYIKSLSDRPTLVGIDFAFSVPVPFPVSTLRDPRELWALVDKICMAAVDDDIREYYGGPVWLSDQSPFFPYVRYGQHRGDKFDGKLLRHTDRACRPRAASIYKLMYSQVGRGSFAGMRVLKSLDEWNGLVVWPFDEIDFNKVVVVEIYPSAFYAMADCKRPNPEKQKREEVDIVLDKVLRRFNVTCGYARPLSQDEIDAYVSAAALAHLSKETSAFAIPEHLRETVAKEGWIFGIPTGGSP